MLRVRLSLFFLRGEAGEAALRQSVHQRNLLGWLVSLLG